MIGKDSGEEKMDEKQASQLSLISLSADLKGLNP